jgi:hypothetical protein
MSPTGSVVERVRIFSFQEQVANQWVLMMNFVVFLTAMMNISTKENQPEKHVVFVADQIFN